MNPEQIKELRSKLGLTQEGLARELGVSVSAVQKWEGGRASPRGLYHKALTELAQRSGRSSSAV
jgi:DNA-binding transcriptional regulator YiaG